MCVDSLMKLASAEITDKNLKCKEGEVDHQKDGQMSSKKKRLYPHRLQKIMQKTVSNGKEL